MSKSTYVRGIKANQVQKVLQWLEEGETPARIAKHLSCDVACIKSFVGKGKEVVPDPTPKLEAKKEVVADSESKKAESKKDKDS